MRIAELSTQLKLILFDLFPLPTAGAKATEGKLPKVQRKIKFSVSLVLGSHLQPSPLSFNFSGQDLGIWQMEFIA